MQGDSTSINLLARVRADDAEAWNRLVELYAPLVMHWLKRYRIAPEDLQDVFQDVFQTTATHLAQFQKERTNHTFRGWLRTITHSKVVDHFRRDQKQARAVGGTAMMQRLETIPEPAAEDPGTGPLRPLFQRLLDELKPCFQENTWKAFELAVLAGRAPKEVALELGMTPGSVRVAKSRVLQRLRQELGDHPDPG